MSHILIVGESLSQFLEYSADWLVSRAFKGTATLVEVACAKVVPLAVFFTVFELLEVMIQWNGTNI